MCQSWEIRYEDNKAINNEGQLKDREVQFMKRMVNEISDSSVL